MRTYDEAYAAAREGSPFSNGTEGYGWMENWCERCVHDVDAGKVDGAGCPLVLVALMGRTPSEWLDGPRDEHGRYSIQGQYHCVEFRDRDDPGPGYEPPPAPPLPGQIELLPAEPYIGARMFADTTARPVCAGQVD